MKTVGRRAAAGASRPFSTDGARASRASPEKEPFMPPLIDREKCTGCGLCAAICNSQLFVHEPDVDKVPRVMFPDECWHCDSCVLDCPAGAITLRIPLPYSLMYVEAETLKKRGDAK
jgi:adenylylsulfate reductase subunit B